MIKKMTITLAILISLWTVTHVLAQGGGALPSNLYTTLPTTPSTVAFACGTVAACVPAQLSTPRIVFGSAALVSGTPSTVTISAISPAFSSTTSYKCTSNDQTNQANPTAITSYVSGSSFTISGAASVTDTVAYICVGN